MIIQYRAPGVDPRLLTALKSEISIIDYNNGWSKLFDRAGSQMYEANDRTKYPILNELYEMMSSPKMLDELEGIFGIPGILPDPHMIGAGYSKIVDYGDLKPHIDFNWNDKLKLYRIATLILYLSTPESGGELEFEGIERIPVKENSMVLFQHSEDIRHFVRPVKGVRYAVRFFYYASKLNPPDNYHRSLYGLENGKPVDIR